MKDVKLILGKWFGTEIASSEEIDEKFVRNENLRKSYELEGSAVYLDYLGNRKLKLDVSINGNCRAELYVHGQVAQIPNDLAKLCNQKFKIMKKSLNKEPRGYRAYESMI